MGDRENKARSHSIGQQLRITFGPLVEEPLPQTFLDLLAQLDERENRDIPKKKPRDGDGSGNG